MSTKPKTASLTGGLVAKKGAAAPSAPQAAVAPAKSADAGPGYYKALTLKLDRERYSKLKTLGLTLDKSSQELLTEAVDDLLRKKL
ncbi:MAG: hypothetical protein M0Z99_34830 [Betaproteobacteria bacterium]|nr:hypothetical protein [Betaproteobacteria bacterium]